LQLGPDLGEGVGSSPPVTVHEHDLRGKQGQAAVLASRLGIHAGLGSSEFFGDTLVIEATELTHLLVGDHREPPWLGALDGVHLLANREF
jgi:hypothetical protein